MKKKRARTRWGNIGLSAKTEPQRLRLLEVGKVLEKKFLERGISVKAKVPKSKVGIHRLCFDVTSSDIDIKDLKKTYDIIENGTTRIWSVPLDFFLEKGTSLMSDLRSLVEAAVFQIGKTGNLEMNCSCKEEGVEAARSLAQESGLEVREKSKQGPSQKPGFVAIVKIADLPKKEKKAASPIIAKKGDEPIGTVGSIISKPKRVPASTPEKVSARMLEAFEKTVMIYLDGLPKKKQLELGLKLIEGQNIGLYLNDDSVTTINGTDKVVVTPITKG